MAQILLGERYRHAERLMPLRLAHGAGHPAIPDHLWLTWGTACRHRAAGLARLARHGENRKSQQKGQTEQKASMQAANSLTISCIHSHIRKFATVLAPDPMTFG
jgi:hypothetical protein